MQLTGAVYALLPFCLHFKAYFRGQSAFPPECSDITAASIVQSRTTKEVYDQHLTAGNT